MSQYSADNFYTASHSSRYYSLPRRSHANFPSHRLLAQMMVNPGSPPMMMAPPGAGPISMPPPGAYVMPGQPLPQGYTPNVAYSPGPIQPGQYPPPQMQAMPGQPYPMMMPQQVPGQPYPLPQQQQQQQQGKDFRTHISQTVLPFCGELPPVELRRPTVT